ncbi:MAG TPA: exosortase A [Rhodopila sp.]
MSAPVLSEAPPAAPSADWRVLAPPLAIGLPLLGFLFDGEVAAAVRTWHASTAYNYCFLVVPIALFLLWDRRHHLVGIPAKPTPMALWLAVPLAVAWLMAERLGIMEGRQLAAVGFVEVLLLAVLGGRLWWGMAGPLLYLYFLVPFGEFLTPKLQDLTTLFIRHGLAILGVPAYIDGYIIEIPQGSFFVAEACAGLRFLIASVAFGCLYALLMYRSSMRRLIFILAAAVVPIVANGLRSLGIVYLGYVLGSARAAAADHVLYGWVFFSFVILALLAFGLPFRQDETSTRAEQSSAGTGAPIATPRISVLTALVVVVVAAVGPVTAAVLTSAAAPVATPARIYVGPDCIVQPTGRIVGVATRSQRVVCGTVPLDLSWEAFSPRSTAAPMMAAWRRMVVQGALTDGLQAHWLDQPDGKAGAWQILQSSDPAYLIAVSVWVDGKAARPGLAMRLQMALNSLTGSAYAPLILTVKAAIDWEKRDPAELNAAADALPHFLLSHPELDATIRALSAR